MPDSEPQGSLKWPNAVSVALLVAYVAAVAWVYYDQAASWPHEGSWANVVFFFLCPGIVFQAFNLAYLRLKQRRLTHRALTRVVTIPLGLVFAAALASSTETLAMRDFEEAYAPFAAQVGANLADPCGAAANYFALPSVAAYNRQAERERVSAKLRYDSKRFVLSFAGGSMDIDGSTIYYDSGAKAWSKFHNDGAAKSGAFAKLTEGLAECVLRAQ